MEPVLRDLSIFFVILHLLKMWLYLHKIQQNLWNQILSFIKQWPVNGTAMLTPDCVIRCYQQNFPCVHLLHEVCLSIVYGQGRGQGDCRMLGYQVWKAVWVKEITPLDEEGRKSSIINQSVSNVHIDINVAKLFQGHVLMWQKTYIQMHSMQLYKC